MWPIVKLRNQGGGVFPGSYLEVVVSKVTWMCHEAQEGSPRQVTRSLFFKAPGHQVTFFHEKIKTTQVTGRFFKLSRSRGRPQNGPRSQVAKNPSWASVIVGQDAHSGKYDFLVTFGTAFRPMACNPQLWG